MINRGETALLVDIGSTYTKASLLKFDRLKISGYSQSRTTVNKDVTIGLKRALEHLEGWQEADYKLACSSAAGGLKLVAIGLVPGFTAEAAKRAALGAGSKVLGTYSYELSKHELEEISRQNADIILLAGGTDGGNKEVILHNARMLARSNLKQPIIIAGNKAVSTQVEKLLMKEKKETYLTENVMPRLEELNIEPSRQKIRELFLERIIKARGLEKVNKIIDGLIMPTPAAVLKAAVLLAEGYQDEPGLGELIVVDIGGATTDIYSIATGKPAKNNINWQGLEEPYQKRTVEGDLGMRYGAPSLLAAVGKEKFQQQLIELKNCELNNEIGLDINCKLQNYIQSLHKDVDYLPQNYCEKEIDNLLARNAARLAMNRHAGYLKTVYTPMGTTSIQEGKDLTGIKTVIGTGGIIVNCHDPGYILEGVLYANQEEPNVLTPVEPEFIVDKKYLLAAIGLLAEIRPELGLQFIKKNLENLKGN